MFLKKKKGLLIIGVNTIKKSIAVNVVAAVAAVNRYWRLSERFYKCVVISFVLMQLSYFGLSRHDFGSFASCFIAPSCSIYD